eukprot:1196087-Prorocentrum_minimum.AAC.2
MKFGGFAVVGSIQRHDVVLLGSLLRPPAGAHLGSLLWSPAWGSFGHFYARLLGALLVTFMLTYLRLFWSLFTLTCLGLTWGHFYAHLLGADAAVHGVGIGEVVRTLWFTFHAHLLGALSVIFTLTCLGLTLPSTGSV